ncbi:hypothetical protein BJV82DRAFT_584179 [Fennellomyces sp. T-0311]|nr:hypothetical protein BJV82DRAFT_584179 [Fennellomyces sp. T-0311]
MDHAEQCIANLKRVVTVGSNVAMQDVTPNQGPVLNLNDIEHKLADIALEGGLSKTQYKRKSFRRQSRGTIVIKPGHCILNLKVTYCCNGRGYCVWMPALLDTHQRFQSISYRADQVTQTSYHERYLQNRPGDCGKSALLVDELHQLGGAYVHLVRCVEDTLSSKDIKEINDIPQIALQSKSDLAFLKNHSLWKYVHDIRAREVVSGYSTCQSENQHKTDAKLLAKRTNFNRALTKQKEGEAFSLLSRLIKIYLHVGVEGHPERCALALMLKLSSKLVLAYSLLKIHEKFDGDGESYNEILRANKVFHGIDRRDYVELKGGYYGKLLLLLRGTYKNELHDFCLIESYIPIANQAHRTGMEVLKMKDGNSAQKMKVICIDDIKRPVHIVPDYSTKQSTDGYYEKYLVNHDINMYSWSENKGKLAKFSGKVTTWDDVRKQ